MIAELRINFAIQILEEFKVLDIPLSRYLSSWFKLHPKAGSKDRRILSDLVYSYFRCYHWLMGISTREKLMSSYFLMGYEDPGILDLLFSRNSSLKPLESGEGSLHQRKDTLTLLYPEIRWESIFPWIPFLSPEIKAEDIEFSLIHQPRVFIRLQEAYIASLKIALKERNIAFEEMGPYCWAFDSRTSLNSLKEGELKAAFEIQDYSSQRTGDFFKAEVRSNWWDCCAGGGGKSLLLSQMYPGTNLWSSDSRFSVLSNLEKRFMESGYPTPRTFVQDLLAEENLPFREGFFDGIIYDAPCTGSGTWSRTPERLGNFHPASLGRITDIQRRIGDKVYPYLNPGGYLIYITCSVFKAENEEIVDYLMDRYSMSLENQEYLNGTHIGADTLFVARLKKNSLENTL